MSAFRDNICLDKLLNNPQVNDFIKWVDSKEDLIWALRKDYISVYYKGLRYVEIRKTDTLKSIPLIKANFPQLGKCPDTEHFALYKSEYENIKRFLDGRKIILERSNQQCVYSKYNNLNITDGLLALDFEFAIPSGSFNDECIKKPEIDLIALDIKNGIVENIVLIEYKCTTSSLGGPNGIKTHMQDFSTIANSDKLIEALTDSIIEMYNIKCRFYNIEPLKINGQIKFIFLFSHLNNRQYINYLKKNKEAIKPNFEVCYWHMNNFETGDFGKVNIVE